MRKDLTLGQVIDLLKVDEVAITYDNFFVLYRDPKFGHIRSALDGDVIELTGELQKVLWEIRDYDEMVYRYDEVYEEMERGHIFYRGGYFYRLVDGKLEVGHISIFSEDGEMEWRETGIETLGMFYREYGDNAMWIKYDRK